MIPDPDFIPYCGAAPTPASLHFTHAPLLTAFLLLFLFAALRSAVPVRASARIAFCAGWLVLAACFLSPLCNLSVALFAARASQHVALTLVAAPLLAEGLRADGRSGPGRLAAANLAFMAVLWLWHAPAFYDATLRDNFVYWTMNLTLICAAVWFWHETVRADGLAALASVTFAGVQMGALGAILTFGAMPLYVVHAGTTTAWGLSQLEDQRLGGLIMWVPGGVLAVGYAAFALWLWFEARARRGVQASAA